MSANKYVHASQTTYIQKVCHWSSKMYLYGLPKLICVKFYYVISLVSYLYYRISFWLTWLKGFITVILIDKKKSHRPIVLIPIHCLGLFSEIHDWQIHVLYLIFFVIKNLQENKFTLCISIIKDTMNNLTSCWQSLVIMTENGMNVF